MPSRSQGYRGYAIDNLAALLRVRTLAEPAAAVPDGWFWQAERTGQVDRVQLWFDKPELLTEQNLARRD